LESIFLQKHKQNSEDSVGIEPH